MIKLSPFNPNNKAVDQHGYWTKELQYWFGDIFKSIQSLILYVNGVSTDPNLSDTTPAAPSGFVNVAFQTDGTNISANIPIGGGGVGNVVGPAGAIAEDIATFNGTTGLAIKDGGKKIADLVLANGAIVGATQTKITYDAKGLVTAGAQAAASDLANGTTGSDEIVLKTSPAILTPTIASFVNAGHNHQDAAGGAVLTEAALSLSDVTTNNASTAKHGFAPKLPNDATKYYDGTGAFTVPAGSSGSTVPSTNDFVLSLVSGDPAFAPQVATPASTDTAADTITFSAAPGWVNGTIVYSNLTVGGITRGTKYFMHAVSSTVFSFHTTVANAISGSSPVNLTSNITDPLIPTGVANTTLYLTPRTGNDIGVYSGSSWSILASAEVSIALGTLTASLPYDVFAYNNAGTLTLELLAWTSGTARATALVRQDGVWSKTGALTRRYAGTIYTISTTTTEDSEENRCVYTPFRPIPSMARMDRTADDWGYNGILRQANGLAANQLQVLVGLPGNVAQVNLNVWGQTTSTTTDAISAIGYNSTSSWYPKSGAMQAKVNASSLSDYRFSLAQCLVMPMPVGIQQFVWLEAAASAGTSFGGVRSAIPYASILSAVFT